MPFTLAHPAIVLPLVFLPRKYISMTALIFGSLVPDAESYIRTYAAKDFAHTWAGFFWFGLPFGLFLTFVFHNVVRNSLIDNFPSFLQQRFSRFREFDWNKRFRQKWPVIIISMIIGGVSHFFWDSFSHFDSVLFINYPRLRGNINLFDRELEIPYLIQYLSTLLGIMLILVFVARMPLVKKPKIQPISAKFWISVLLITTSIFIPRKIRMPVNSLDDILSAILSSLAFGVILASLLFESPVPKSRVGKS